MIDIKQKRKKIHTRTKFLAYTGALPIEYASHLHKSQLSRYRNHFNEAEYFGHELSRIEKDIIEQIRQVNQFKTDRVIVSAYLKIAAVFRGAFAKAKHYKSTLRKNLDNIVDVVQRYKDIVPVSEFASFLKVDESTVRNWIREVRVKCSGTITNLCRKEHPNQLLNVEVQAMKKLLTDRDKLYWPSVSVYYYALHNNIVSMGLSTWYKYVSLLGIKRLKPKSLKVYGESVVGKFPNHYWHADVTQFRTMDGMLHYIYLVVDNFSKKILSWAIDTKLCKEVRMRTFKEAVDAAVGSFIDLKEVNIIVDGGSENNNKTIDGFIESLVDFKIIKEQALKTVYFSNAMAEATNRIVKTYYLNHQNIGNTSALIKFFKFIVNDINAIRPHGRLKGVTPDMAYMGIKPDSDRYLEQKLLARRNRVETNQNAGCCKAWIW